MTEHLSSYLLITGIPLLFGLLVLYKLNPSKKQIKFLLSFSGAFVLGVSFLHLLPESYETNTQYVSYCVLGGFLLQLFLEYFSQGIEHGHVHAQNDKRFPFTIFLSLCIHALIEGIPISGHNHGHHHGENSLLIGVLLHKIPIAITLASFLITSKVSKTKGLIALVVFAAMAPIGMYISETSFNHEYLSYATAFVVGMLLHISTTILFESSEGHKFNVVKLISILTGIGLAIITNPF